MADDELGLPKKVYVNPAPFPMHDAADNNSVSDNNTIMLILTKLLPAQQTVRCLKDSLQRIKYLYGYMA
jgi:hypothetical protein